MGLFLNTLGRLAGGFVDVLMPPACVACKAPVARAGLYCPDCFAALPRIPEPLCNCCGAPLPIEQAADALCLSCSREPPAFAHARAAYFYDGPARDTVIALKYGQETLAPLMARAMLMAALPLPEKSLVVPVPVHRWRLASRGFNQALLLARPIARTLGGELVPTLLQRTKHTPRSVAMSAKARARKVAGAFAVPPGMHPLLKGRHVLLVDDVLTTGATVAACSRVLLRAGATSVDVLVFARVAGSALSH